MPIDADVVTSPSWQSRLVDLVIRSYMRPHSLKPIDPGWVRRRMGRQDVPRRLMVRATGVRMSKLPPTGAWPGGEMLVWPDADVASTQLRAGARK